MNLEITERLDKLEEKVNDLYRKVVFGEITTRAEVMCNNMKMDLQNVKVEIQELKSK